MTGKTVGAIVCVVVVLILWVEALAALLHYAQAGDPGAYLVAAFVFLLLPGAAVAFVVLMVRDQSGYYDRAPSPVPALLPAPEPRAQLHRMPRYQLDGWSEPRIVFHIDTVNVYQAAPLEQPQPARVPAEVRRIRPVIER